MDIAAGDAILRSAGGTVLNKKGNEINMIKVFYWLFLCCFFRFMEQIIKT